MPEGQIILTPTKSIAHLTGATDHAIMTVDEAYSKCSTPATNAASPRLARKGEVVLRLSSVFIRTIGVPVESRIENSPNYQCGGSCPGLAHGVNIWCAHRERIK